MDTFDSHVLRRRRHGQGGFTLIELLVVIAVLAILAVVVLFNVTGVRNKGQAAGCATDVKTVQTAVDAFLSDGNTGLAAGNYTAPFTGLLDLLSTKNYIHNTTSACTTLTLTTAGTGFNVTGS